MTAWARRVTHSCKNNWVRKDRDIMRFARTLTRLVRRCAIIIKVHKISTQNNHTEQPRHAMMV